MAKFMYVGDERVTEIFGLVFVQGQATEVSDPAVEAKLKAHPLFASDDGDAEAKAKAKADAKAAKK